MIQLLTKKMREVSIMNKSKALKSGDKVAIVSLSSGMLGEEFCSHNIAIGGDDTYRLLPYLLEDEGFVEAVKKHPKLFTGFSDTTINHLMLYKLGLSTFYGPNFICDLGEIANDMLPYTKKAFEGYLEGNEVKEILASDVWYEEREDFSRNAIGTDRVVHKEQRGFELLQGKAKFQGRLLGGCLESFYDILEGTRYDEEIETCRKYGLFPTIEEWKDKILFIETCEEKPTPELFRKELSALKKQGIFNVISGIIVGKPQDETYYEEYKKIYPEVIENKELPILYNVNFGHATPRCALPYGADVLVDAVGKRIVILESPFET